MKKIFVVGSIFLLAFNSCKKDSSAASTGGNALTGTWQFTGMTAQTLSADQYVNGGDNFQDVTTSQFVTDSNGGKITFSGGTATSTGITYAVNTTAYVTSYEDGALVDTFSTPFNVTVPASNSVSTYKIIGSDSVYFASGFVTSGAISGGTQATTPSGLKFSIAGNIMHMTSYFVKDTLENLGGIPTQFNDTASYNVTLTKQ